MKTRALRVLTIAIVCAALAMGAGAQIMQQAIVNLPPANKFLPAQFKYFSSTGSGTGGSSCAAPSATCSVTVSSVPVGHTLVFWTFYVNSGGQLTLNSVSGETTVHCPTCAAYTSSVGGIDVRYVLAAAGGETSFACALSGSAAVYLGCGVMDWSYTGPSASYDTSNIGSITTCNPCAGQTLSIGGNNDAIVQLAIPSSAFSSVTNPYAANAGFSDGAGAAFALNVSSGAGPNWSAATAVSGVVTAIALKGN